MTEFDRLFRHFYFRDVANETALKLKEGERPKKVFLDEDHKWTDDYFFKGGFKSRRREMFFNIASPCWIAGAGKHSNDEPSRPPKKKKARSAAAKSATPKTAAAKKSKTKTAKTKKSKIKSKVKTSKVKAKARPKTKGKSKAKSKTKVKSKKTKK
jgi:hypothetical protein